MKAKWPWLLSGFVLLLLVFLSFKNTPQVRQRLLSLQPAFPLDNLSASYRITKEGEYYWVKYQPNPVDEQVFTKVLLGDIQVSPQDYQFPVIITGQFRFGDPKCRVGICTRPQGNSLLLDIASIAPAPPFPTPTVSI